MIISGDCPKENAKTLYYTNVSMSHILKPRHDPHPLKKKKPSVQKNGDWGLGLGMGRGCTLNIKKFSFALWVFGKLPGFLNQGLTRSEQKSKRSDSPVRGTDEG